MKIEQFFSESDLSELEQILVKSMSPNRVMRSCLEHKRAIRRCLFGCTIVLFVCCIFFLYEHDKWRALISAICGVFAFVYNKLWNKLVDKFFNSEKVVQKYREPFVVAVKENTLHFRESDFPISSIDYIIEYKSFLIIRANKRWCFIKAEEEEKAMLLSKFNSNSNITFTKVNELIDLRQFR